MADPLVVALEGAEQLLPLADQFRLVPAAQPAGAVQVTFDAAPQLPSLQVNVALPLFGANVLLSVIGLPLLAEDVGAAEQLAVPCDQLRAVELDGHNCGGGGAQDEAGAAFVSSAHTPSVQMNLADPVVPVKSFTGMVDPLADAVDAAEQVLPLTLQLKVALAAQDAGAGRLQVALAAAPQTPLPQEKLAEPVVGALASVKVRVAPLVDKPREALQVLPLTVQDWLALAAQSTGAVQVAFDAAPQLPSLQVNVALPLFGANVLLSVIGLPLLAEDVGAAEQLAVPCDQLRAVVFAWQAAGVWLAVATTNEKLLTLTEMKFPFTEIGVISA